MPRAAQQLDGTPLNEEPSNEQALTYVIITHRLRALWSKWDGSALSKPDTIMYRQFERWAPGQLLGHHGAHSPKTEFDNPRPDIVRTMTYQLEGYSFTIATRGTQLCVQNTWRI